MGEEIVHIDQIIEKAIPLSKDCHFERLRQTARRQELKEGILLLLSKKCENCPTFNQTSEHEIGKLGVESKKD